MRDVRLASVSVTAGTAALALLTACGNGSTPAGAVPASSSSATAAAVEPRGLLAARAAAAKDRRYVLGYTLSAPNKPVRSVLVTVALDGTWRVDIQGGALGGAVDVSIAGRPEGQYQCTLNASAVCVRVAALGKKLPPPVDPRAQYPFTGWLDVLVDRQVPLAVSITEPLPGAGGTCFAVDPAVTAVQPPIDPGVFCYADDGMLTAARLPIGTLAMAGQPASAPPTVVLPGPVSNGAPLPTAAQTTVSPSPSR
jgi:hypothetical protein